jgi:phytoene dehydrogenase-like protein
MKTVVVVGGGVGGLVAAARLAARGHRVRLFEARQDTGGLASRVCAGGLTFDGGPYILLDRPGLEWAFEKIALDVAALDLEPITHLYDVEADNQQRVRVFLDLDRTAEEFDHAWPGAGSAYRHFVAEMDRLRQMLAPMLVTPEPSVIELARRGSLGAAPFLVRSLAGVLRRRGLPREVLDAVAIWTHVAGQPLSDAASVMAFVPALIHRVGAFVPSGGMQAVPMLLRRRVEESGVEVQCGVRVARILTQDRSVTGVALESGETMASDAVISNYSGVGTYEELVADTPASVRQTYHRLPLQSPGLCAYLSARGRVPDPYLRFMRDACGVTLAVYPANRDRIAAGQRFSMRLIRPLGHDQADQIGEDGQAKELKRLLDRDWWKDGLSDVELVASRTARQWGRDMNLYRDSMNPAMNRSLLLRGRLRHRSPWIRGLYLAGASTHPGQWVSFCAISGVLAADAVHADFTR